MVRVGSALLKNLECTEQIVVKRVMKPVHGNLRLDPEVIPLLQTMDGLKRLPNVMLWQETRSSQPFQKGA
jgi:hypothetical protein